jgi:ferric-dicitrate binding protein FerR (iron transport regulator)
VLARRRLAFCLSQYQAIRRHRVEVEQAIARLAGPLAEVQGWASARLPAARRELQQMVEVLQRYNQSVPPPSSNP